ncbi:hypothetical protein BDN72DRAFT_964964 [Pluteus cervinus]|uniref:Uncharacterized protein n=1 Tax=Pluteus cervinus TaxID=181527 RepID=A0ACD3A7F9_9AGAR|nr:hypothetical protein BDN72DRAFT_964964 [Pluteus cervinus]
MVQSTTPPLAMEPVRLLPKEIWAQVVDTYPVTQFRSLMLVNRMFYEIVYRKLWENLTLCSMDIARQEKVKEILKKPELGSRVTHVSIQHYPLGKHTNYSEGRCRETYSRPEAFALFNWDKPGQSVRRILLTPRKTVETAIKVVPRLPNVRSLTINLLPVSLVRHANLHHSLWSTFTSNKIVQLTIKIHIPQIETIASFIESAPSVLGHLVELVICLTGTEISSEVLQRSLHAIINPARQTIQSVIVSSTNQLDPEAIIQGIGQIQNLTRLQLNLSALMIHKLEDADLLTRFLKQHKSTLKHLSFKSLPYESLERRWFAPGLSPVYCPPLKSISLRIERVANDQNSFSFPVPHLASFSGSLTTLLLDLGSHFLSFEDTRKLVKSLYRVPGGALLRELKIAIQPLKAEFFDVFADDLENLEVLDLTYALSPEGPDDVEGRVALFREISQRNYVSSKLRHLNVWVSTRNQVTLDWEKELDMELMKRLRRCMPMIYEFGRLDWSHVEKDIPLYVSTGWFLGF